MIFGKTLRVFAATLVLTSSISFANPGGTGTNNTAGNVPKGTNDPTALFVAQTELPPTDVELPDGTIATQRTTILSASATTAAQVLNLEAIGQAAVKTARAQDGVVIPLLIEGDAESRASIKKIFEDENNRLVNDTDPQVQTPKDWKQWWEFYKDDYSTLKDSGFKIGEGNRTLTLIRTTMNFGSPFVIAVYFSGVANIPWWAALPYCAAFGAMSGTLSAYPYQLPWNRISPKDPEAATINSKFQTIKDWGVKGVVWTAVELGFLEVAKEVMTATNYFSQVLVHEKYLHVATHPYLLWTAFLGAISQGGWELANSKLKETRIAKILSIKDVDPVLFQKKLKSVQDAFYRIGFTASVLSVSLSAYQMLHQSDKLLSNTLFGVFTAGGVLFMSKAFGWHEKIGEYFGLRVKDIDDVPDSDVIPTETKVLTDISDRRVESCQNRFARLFLRR